MGDELMMVMAAARRIEWPVWAGVACLVVAGVYAVVYPGGRAGGAARFVIRWFHALVWVLVAGACFAWGLWPERAGAAKGLAPGAGAVYVVFLVAAGSGRK